MDATMARQRVAGISLHDRQLLGEFSFSPPFSLFLSQNLWLRSLGVSRRRTLARFKGSARSWLRSLFRAVLHREKKREPLSESKGYLSLRRRTLKISRTCRLHGRGCDKVEGGIVQPGETN